MVFESYTENINLQLLITTLLFMILGFIYFIYRLKRLIQPINIDVTFGEHLAITDVMIDPATPVPEGLEFKDNKITGTVNTPVNTFIRIVYTDDLDVINGGTLDLTVLAIEQKEASGFESLEPETPPVQPEEEEKGCGGSIMAASAIISILTLAGAGLLFLRRKEN